MPFRGRLWRPRSCTLELVMSGSFSSLVTRPKIKAGPMGVPRPVAVLTVAFANNLPRRVNEETW